MSDDRCELLCLDLPHAEQARDRLAKMDAIERRAEQARALGDPTRLRVAAALRVGGEMCVCDLAWVVGQADQLVSHHVRLLRTAGLASSRRQGKLVLYSLTAQGTDLVDAVFDGDASTSWVAANSVPLAGGRS
jgi:DNA-binding transcriptional ArsR family regulator